MTLRITLACDHPECGATTRLVSIGDDFPEGWVEIDGLHLCPASARRVFREHLTPKGTPRDPT